MTTQLIRTLAETLMRQPTAPYHEHRVRGAVERICAEHGLAWEQDRFGNVLVRWKNARTRPLVLAAHMDHPGFEIVRQLSATTWLARFHGGVADSFFRPGTRVRVLPGQIPTRLGRRQGRERIFELKLDRHSSRAESSKAKAAFAVWELEDFAVRHGRIHGRACDDLIGVAAILATLIELRRCRAPANVLGLISRAEEIGFQGALALAADRKLPKNSLVISLETSRELPGVKMGQGVILRVGDRTSIFDPKATRFLGEVACELQAARKRFHFQRGLMSGGTCEATAYQEWGYQTAAVCVALGNYHNCAPANRLRAEYVDLRDVESMVELLVSTAWRMRDYEQLTGKLPNRLQELLREARRRLPQSANG